MVYHLSTIFNYQNCLKFQITRQLVFLPIIFYWFYRLLLFACLVYHKSYVHGRASTRELSQALSKLISCIVGPFFSCLELK